MANTTVTKPDLTPVEQADAAARAKAAKAAAAAAQGETDPIKANAKPSGKAGKGDDFWETPSDHTPPPRGTADPVVEKTTTKKTAANTKEAAAKAQRAEAAGDTPTPTKTPVKAEANGKQKPTASKKSFVKPGKKPEILTGELLPAIIEKAEMRGSIDGKDDELFQILPKPYKDEAEARAGVSEVVRSGQIFSGKLFEFLQRDGVEKLGYVGKGVDGSKGDWQDCLKKEIAEPSGLSDRALRYIEASHTVLDNLRDHIQTADIPLLEPADLPLFAADTLRAYSDLPADKQVEAAVLTLANAPKTRDKRARPKVTAVLARQVVAAMQAPTHTERAERIARAKETPGGSNAIRGNFIDAQKAKETPEAGEVEVTRLTLIGDVERDTAAGCYWLKAEDEANFPYLLSVPFAAIPQE